jgi:hypothetical protein
VLKDLITNQRQDIIKKDKDIEILQQTIADISNEFENAQTFQEENEELIYANTNLKTLKHFKKKMKN